MRSASIDGLLAPIVTVVSAASATPFVIDLPVSAAETATRAPDATSLRKSCAELYVYWAVSIRMTRKSRSSQPPAIELPRNASRADAWRAFAIGYRTPPRKTAWEPARAPLAPSRGRDGGLPLPSRRV